MLGSHKPLKILKYNSSLSCTTLVCSAHAHKYRDCNFDVTMFVLLSLTYKIWMLVTRPKWKQM